MVLKKTTAWCHQWRFLRRLVPTSMLLTVCVSGICDRLSLTLTQRQWIRGREYYYESGVWRVYTFV